MNALLTRLVRSELLKLRTTKTWWLFILCNLLSTALAGGVRMLQLQMQMKYAKSPRISEHATPEQIAAMKAKLALELDTLRISSDLFTSGQFMGCLLAMLLGIVLITSEYQHQTATTTFLTTPKRTPVILAKFVTALITASVLWAIATALDVTFGGLFLSSKELPSHLGEWPILQSMVLNLMIYALWSTFGVGWGVLMRSQIGATMTGALGYVLGSQIAMIVFTLIHQYWIKEDWVFSAMVVVPTKAAEIAVSPTLTYLQSPAQWVGVVVMLAYGIGLGAIGTAIIRKRDVT